MWRVDQHFGKPQRYCQCRSPHPTHLKAHTCRCPFCAIPRIGKRPDHLVMSPRVLECSGQATKDGNACSFIVNWFPSSLYILYLGHYSEMTVSVHCIISAFLFRLERSDTKYLSANMLRASSKGQSGLSPVAPLDRDTSISSCLLSTSYYMRRSCGFGGVRSVGQSCCVNCLPSLLL